MPASAWLCVIAYDTMTGVCVKGIGHMVRQEAGDLRD